MRDKLKKLSLQSHLSAQDIWNQIMEVQIEAFQSLLEEKSLNKWENILTCFDRTLEYAENLAQEYINTFRSLQGNVYYEDYNKVYNFMTHVNERWFRSIGHILYQLEDMFMANNPEAIRELWDDYFSWKGQREIYDTEAMRILRI